MAVYQYIVGNPAPACSDTERSALFRGVAKLGGSSNWLLRSGWGEAADCCEWRGVRCAGGRGVEQLSLAKQQLEGTLPTELGALTNLVSIDLNENVRLSGTLPTERMRRLPPQTLPLHLPPSLGRTRPRLSVNSHPRARVISPCATVGAASRLTHVYAFGARVSGTLPPSVGSSHTLQELELSSCKLSGTLPSSMPGCTSLRYVFLESNRISGEIPAGMGRLRHLRELELSHNRLSGSVPRALVRMHLDHLDVADNSPQLHGVPQAKPSQGCSGGGDRYLRGAGTSASHGASLLSGSAARGTLK
jgi:hypothetical protein